MRIVVKAQSVVSDIVGGIDRLLHSAKRCHFNEVLNAVASHVLQQCVEALCHIGFLALSLEVEAKAGSHSRQIVQFVGVGHVVDTVGERLGLFAFLGDAHAFSHCAVGQQHELLHQLVSILSLFEVDAERFAVLVNLESRFLAVKVDGTLFEAFVAQHVGHAVQRDEQVCVLSFSVVGRHWCDRQGGWVDRGKLVTESIQLSVGQYFLCWNRLCRRSLALANQLAFTGFAVLFQQILHFLISVSAITLDNRVENAVAQHFGFVVHLEDDGERQFLLIGPERTELVAEVFRQHRNGSVHQINRCGTLLSLFVDDGTFLHIVAHIGDVYTHFPKSLFQRLDGDGVVKVFGVAWVDGDCEGVAQVFSLCDFFGCDACVHAVGCSFHFLRVFVGQAVFSQNGVHLSIVFAFSAQHINHLSDGVASIQRPVVDTYHDFVAILGALQFLHRYDDVALHF